MCARPALLGISSRRPRPRPGYLTRAPGATNERGNAGITCRVTLFSGAIPRPLSLSLVFSLSQLYSFFFSLASFSSRENHSPSLFLFLHSLSLSVSPSSSFCKISPLANANAKCACSPACHHTSWMFHVFSLCLSHTLLRDFFSFVSALRFDSALPCFFPTCLLPLRHRSFLRSFAAPSRPIPNLLLPHPLSPPSPPPTIISTCDYID